MSVSFFFLHLCVAGTHLSPDAGGPGCTLGQLAGPHSGRFGRRVAGVLAELFVCARCAKRLSVPDALPTSHQALGAGGGSSTEGQNNVVRCRAPASLPTGAVTRAPTSLHSLKDHFGHGSSLQLSVSTLWCSLHSRSTKRRPKLFMQYDSLLRLPRPHVFEH